MTSPQDACDSCIMITFEYRWEGVSEPSPPLISSTDRFRVERDTPTTLGDVLIEYRELGSDKYHVGCFWKNTGYLLNGKYLGYDIPLTQLVDQDITLVASLDGYSVDEALDEYEKTKTKNPTPFAIRQLSTFNRPGNKDSTHIETSKRARIERVKY